MAKVVARGALNSSSFQISGGAKVAPMTKRKTPSELRGEQLKRTNYVEQTDGSFYASHASKSAIVRDNGLKKQEQLKNLRYIEMRMDELYPAKKARFWMHPGKENSKENDMKEQSSSLKNLSLLSDVAANKREQLTCQENKTASKVSDDAKAKGCPTIEGCSEHRLRSVKELSTGGQGSSSLVAIDMNKALKALATCEGLPGHPAGSTEKSDNPSSGTFRAEFQVPGQKIPLDLSLKTYIRLVSSSSVNWLYRSILCSTYNGMPQLKSLSNNIVNQDTSSSSGSAMVSQVLSSMALNSWVYPQSTLPSSIISLLAASGQDRAEIDFLRNRQMAWEDSFRSLYFMFRKNVCNIFYVRTSQFVVLFTASCDLGGAKRSCNGYVTRSTRSLRALLKEHEISYSMPLCQTKVEQVTTEDLVELSEIEKHNLGQTRRRSSFSDIDNTPESLLAFVGNENVHGLYDFLLNYRSSLGFASTTDVPVLYSPVPFQNAALSSPEIKCMEMTKTEHIGSTPVASQSRDNENVKASSGDRCYIVEMKAACLPPWIISNTCAIMAADGRSFEASFSTEQTSIGLNIALPEVPEQTNPESIQVAEGKKETSDAFGISGATVCPQLRSGQLKGLKHCNKSYMVSLSPS